MKGIDGWGFFGLFVFWVFFKKKIIMGNIVGFCFAYATHLETMCVELVLCSAFVISERISSFVLCDSFIQRQVRSINKDNEMSIPFSYTS